MTIDKKLQDASAAMRAATSDARYSATVPGARRMTPMLALAGSFAAVLLIFGIVGASTIQRDDPGQGFGAGSDSTTTSVTPESTVAPTSTTIAPVVTVDPTTTSIAPVSTGEATTTTNLSEPGTTSASASESVSEASGGQELLVLVDEALALGGAGAQLTDSFIDGRRMVAVVDASNGDRLLTVEYLPFDDPLHGVDIGFLTSEETSQGKYMTIEAPTGQLHSVLLSESGLLTIRIESTALAAGLGDDGLRSAVLSTGSGLADIDFNP